MTTGITTILNQLNSTEGIKGSLIITPDGMPVTSQLPDNQDEETLAAVSSSIFLAISKSMEKLNTGGVIRYVLNAEFGRTFLVDLDKMILIILAEKDIKLAKVNVAIFQAANAIRKSGRLDVE